MATSSPTTLTAKELHEQFHAIHCDAIDLSHLIKIAVRDFDDDPQAAFALLRSIDLFNDAMFDKLSKLWDITKAQAEEGGAV